jgi:hypothetical protein
VLVLITEEAGCITYADVLAPDVELIALARALVVAPGVLAVAVRAGARQLLAALVQVWRWRRSRSRRHGWIRYCLDRSVERFRISGSAW